MADGIPQQSLPAKHSKAAQAATDHPQHQRSQHHRAQGVIRKEFQQAHQELSPSATSRRACSVGSLSSRSRKETRPP